MQPLAPALHRGSQQRAWWRRRCDRPPLAPHRSAADRSADPVSASRVHCQVFVHTWNPESAAFIDASYGAHLRASQHQPVEQRSNRCRKQGGPDFGQLALQRLPLAPDHAPGCPKLRPASSNHQRAQKKLGLLRWPAIQGLVFDLGNNGRSQSLSVGRAALLMRAHERLRGRPYTLALALRADVALGSPFALASMDPRHVWLPAMCGSVVKRQSWLGPSSAPAPSQGLPWRLEAVGQSQGERPAHWAPSHCLGCSSSPPPELPMIPQPLTIQVRLLEEGPRRTGHE